MLYSKTLLKPSALVNSEDIKRTVNKDIFVVSDVSNAQNFYKSEIRDPKQCIA